MTREAAGIREIHTSHELSRRVTNRREEPSWNNLPDYYLATKIELRFNESKGVQ